jgi:hypothetical protein
MTCAASLLAVFICDECVALCDDIVEDEKIQSLLKADEESGHQGYPATTEHLRAKSTAELVSCGEGRTHVAERYRLELSLIWRMLAVRDGEPPAADTDPMIRGQFIISVTVLKTAGGLAATVL